MTQKSSNLSKLLLHVGLLTATAILTIRVDLLPDWIYASGVKLTSLDKPFDIVFQTEKLLLIPWIAFCIHRLYGLKRGSRAPATAVVITQATAAAAVVLIAPAMLVHYVAFEPKLPALTGVWALHNLVWVCLPEEMIFRNYLFEVFRRTFQATLRPQFFAGAASALVFGAMHIRGGLEYALLATLAGGAYAYAYAHAGLAAAVFTHFGVNLIHFLLFSYPQLQIPAH